MKYFVSLITSAIICQFLFFVALFFYSILHGAQELFWGRFSWEHMISLMLTAPLQIAFLIWLAEFALMPIFRKAKISGPWLDILVFGITILVFLIFGFMYKFINGSGTSLMAAIDLTGILLIASMAAGYCRYVIYNNLPIGKKTSINGLEEIPNKRAIK